MTELLNLIGTIISKLIGLSTTGWLFVICALFVPPLAVYLKVGFATHFFINVLLTVLGWVPGQLHALWVVLFL